MRRTYYLILSCIFVLVLKINVFAFTGSGSGTVDDPYEIENTGHLNEINNDMSASYILTNDIDLGNQTWEPIGWSESGKLKQFKGSLDGKGYKIKNLKIDLPDKNSVGLFAVTEEAYFSNIIIENINISGKYYVGGLVGDSYDTSFNECEIRGSGKILGNHYIGGICGFGRNIGIHGCITKIEIEGYGGIGGLCGSLFQSAVKRSYSDSNIKGQLIIGGLVGSGVCIIMDNCYFIGTITSESNTGGLIGMLSEYGDILPTSVKNSYSSGNIFNSSSYGCGGLIGIVVVY